MITFVSLAVPQVSLIESGQPLLGNYTIAMLMLWLGTEGFFGDLFTGFSSYYTCLTSEATKAPKKESIPAWIKLDVQATGEIPHKGLRSTRIGFVCYWNETSSTLFKNPFCYFGQQKHLRYLRGMRSPYFAKFRCPRIKRLSYMKIMTIPIRSYHVTNLFAPSSGRKNLW